MHQIRVEFIKPKGNLRIILIFIKIAILANFLFLIIVLLQAISVHRS